MWISTTLMNSLSQWRQSSMWSFHSMSLAYQVPQKPLTEFRWFRTALEQRELLSTMVPDCSSLRGFSSREMKSGPSGDISSCSTTFWCGAPSSRRTSTTSGSELSVWIQWRLKISNTQTLGKLSPQVLQHHEHEHWITLWKAIEQKKKLWSKSHNKMPH